MKMVTLTRDLRPWRQGDRVPLPDTLADELVQAGDAADPADWGAATVCAPPAAATVPAAAPNRPPAAGGFATRRLKGG